MITLFYDAQCPLCVAEMRKLKKADLRDEVQLVDIHDSQTMAAYPQVQFSAANRILHAVDEQGQLYLGLDATVRECGDKSARCDGWLFYAGRSLNGLRILPTDSSLVIASLFLGY